jgi:hypothetical protein
MERKISKQVLEEILDIAGLYLLDEDDYGDDPDGVGLRLSYRGRGYAPEGFGLVVNASKLMVLAAAAGIFSHENPDELDALAFAAATHTDSMGHDLIAYWPGWKLGD